MKWSYFVSSSLNYLPLVVFLIFVSQWRPVAGSFASSPDHRHLVASLPSQYMHARTFQASHASDFLVPPRARREG